MIVRPGPRCSTPSGARWQLWNPFVTDVALAGPEAAKLLDAAHPLSLLLRSRFHANQRVTVTDSRDGVSTQAELTLTSQHPTCA